MNHYERYVPDPIREMDQWLEKHVVPAIYIVNKYDSSLRHKKYLRLMNQLHGGKDG